MKKMKNLPGCGVTAEIARLRSVLSKRCSHGVYSLPTSEMPCCNKSTIARNDLEIISQKISSIGKTFGAGNLIFKKMKNSVLVFLVLVSVTNISFSQTLDGYLSSKGVYNLGKAAHASNDYKSGTYIIGPDYVDVSVRSRDNFFGAAIRTDLRLVKGAGDLFFSDIIVVYDNDFVRPFEAFGFQISLVESLIRTMDERTYLDMRNSVQETFNTDFEKWTGKMWALLAINLEYYQYLLTGE